MTEHPAVAQTAAHVNPAFVKLLGVFGYGRVFTRARGVHVWDHEGRRYLDCLAGFGSVNLGHNHPRLVAKMTELLQSDALHFCHAGPAVHAAALAEALAARVDAPLEIVMFSSSGGEAVEAGLKLARAATGRTRFVHCADGYHGTSLGTLSIMGAGRMRAPFEPLLPSAEVPFGDLAALERALAGRQVAAFVVEPILGEGGVVLPRPGYLAAAQELCRKHGTLLVLDEVQTGLGRTGTLWAYQQEGFVPDVLCLAKALSGGIAPISATIVRRDHHEKAYGTFERFDLHSTTFGGNALSAAAALETLRIVDEEGLAAKSAALGKRLLGALRERLHGHPFVKEVRGRGLLVAIELGPTGTGWLSRLAPGLVSKVSEAVLGQWLALKLLERGILCQPAVHHWNVLKIEPPLTVGEAELDEVVTTTGAVLDEYRDLGTLLKDVSVTVGSQWRRGWTF